MARFVPLSLLISAWAGVSVATPVSQVPDSRLSFLVNGHALSIPYERNLSLTGSYPQVQRAVVLVHGTNRNAAQAYDNLRDAAAVAGVQDGTALLVAPQFLIEEDITLHALASDVLFWSEPGWKEGDRSAITVEHPRPDGLSSFAIMDSILYRIASRNPNLQTIVLAGHSAGGQFVQRYAAGNTMEQWLQSEFGVSVQYVVANPSSYLYFNAKRARAGTTDVFEVPPAPARQACPDYNRYKYGLLQLNPYMASLSVDAIKSQYASRRVTVLLGELDADPADPSMDMSCAANFQGDHRLERGQIFRNHLVEAFGSSVLSSHRFEVIPGVGHSSSGMFTSECGASVLYGAAACASVAVAEPLVPEPRALEFSVPNPLRVPASLQFSLPQDGARVTLRIHDVFGRLVRTLLDGDLPAGAGTVQWDGRSENGTRVAPGLYLCRLQQGLAVSMVKIVLLP